MQSLKASRLRNRNNSDNGEFSCPLCRQMGNSVLPINPELNRKTSLKNYCKQPQYNLNKRQDSTSVNQHVARMFELLAFNSLNADEELMNDVNELNDEAANQNQIATISLQNSNAIESRAAIEFKNIENDSCSNECTADSASNKLSRQSTLSDSPSFELSCDRDILKETCLELMNLYTHIPTPDSNLLKSFSLFCEDLTKSTGPQYRSVKTSPTPHVLYLFMCSILRTNLETELLVKLSKSSVTGAKKSCLGNQFNALSIKLIH